MFAQYLPPNEADVTSQTVETSHRVVDVSPKSLDPSQDQLLLAGSKLSFAELYDKQMQIPLKGKYYRADDVDDTFILMNGVLTDISKNAFRQHKQMIELQQEAHQLRERVELLESQNQEMTDIKDRLDQRENDLRRLATVAKTQIDSQKEKIRDDQAEIRSLNEENTQLAETIDLLILRIQELEKN